MFKRRTREQCISDFVNKIKEKGGNVIGNYVDKDTPVECLCPSGHIIQIRPSYIRKPNSGICCNSRSNRPEIAFEKFRKSVEEKGGTVIGKYIKSSLGIECICSENHRCFPSPNNLLKSGRGICLDCSGQSPKIAEENFYKNILLLGGRVIGKYINNHSKIECSCRYGHIVNILPKDINSGQGMCLICTHRIPIITELKFRNKIKDYTIKIMSSYVDIDTPIRCLCYNKHFITIIPYNFLKRGYKCESCNKL